MRINLNACAICERTVPRTRTTEIISPYGTRWVVHWKCINDATMAAKAHLATIAACPTQEADRARAALVLKTEATP